MVWWINFKLQKLRFSYLVHHIIFGEVIWFFSDSIASPCLPLSGQFLFPFLELILAFALLIRSCHCSNFMIFWLCLSLSALPLFSNSFPFPFQINFGFCLLLNSFPSPNLVFLSTLLVSVTTPTSIILFKVFSFNSGVAVISFLYPFESFFTGIVIYSWLFYHNQ